jgi:site-specific DNA-methyltransferase (adenine-specific)
VPLRKNDPRQAVRLYLGDCLEVLRGLPAGSVDLVLADPPYGTTACKWDSVIPLESMWQELRRVLRPCGAVVLTATQPFTSVLVTSNLLWFKYTWVWKKTRPGGHVSAKLKPLKDVEDVCVFSDGTTANGSQRNMTYYPQGVRPGRAWKRPAKYAGSPGISYSRPSHATERTLDGEGYPRSILEFANPNRGLLHPTQKPVALMEYLVRTYTNEGDMVLDFCMGSGTTGIACLQTGRKFIGIELSPRYHAIATHRIAQAEAEAITNGTSTRE